MWPSCALVSRMLATCALALSASPLFDEQPARAMAAESASVSRSERLPGICVSVQFGAVPPAAAERLEQSRGVDKSRGLRLHEAEPRLVVGLLGVENRQIGIVPVLVA